LSTFERDRPPAHLLLGELTGLDADNRQRLRARPPWLRPLLVSRFALVGATGLVVNQALLWSAVAMGHLNYVLGAVLATQGSTTWNFLLLDRWVFPERKERSGLSRYLTFSGVNNLTLLLRVPLLAALVSLLHVHYLLANVVTLVVLFASRFVVSDRLIWRAPLRRPPPQRRPPCSTATTWPAWSPSSPRWCCLSWTASRPLRSTGRPTSASRSARSAAPACAGGRW
jgi:putative flippase GtrA